MYFINYCGNFDVKNGISVIFVGKIYINLWATLLATIDKSWQHCGYDRSRGPVVISGVRNGSSHLKKRSFRHFLIINFEKLE
jgi:hypothetical protein